MDGLFFWQVRPYGKCRPSDRDCRRLGRIALFASSLSVKDVSYLVSAAIKQECRRKTGSLSANAIAAADETAWACVRQMRELAIIAPVGADEVFDSFVFKYHHNDFEDDLMLGVANRIDADYVVTGIKTLSNIPMAYALTFTKL